MVIVCFLHVDFLVVKKQRSRSFCAGNQFRRLDCEPIYRRGIQVYPKWFYRNSRWLLCKRSTAGRIFSHWSSRENVLCIYVEYCVTSRAGKCLETCNTDKPRFDDFVAVRASYASVQLALPALFRLLCVPAKFPDRGSIPRSKFS